MILVILVIFPISGNKGKKNKIYYNEKKFCAEKLNFGLLPKYIAMLGSWAGRWARLLGMQALGARGARRRTCVGARARAQVGAGARGARARGKASGRSGVGGSDARGGARGARGRAGSAWARGARPPAGVGRAAWGGRLDCQCAPGCAQLGQVWVLCTLTQFLARFDSVLFLSH